MKRYNINERKKERTMLLCRMEVATSRCCFSFELCTLDTALSCHSSLSQKAKMCAIWHQGFNESPFLCVELAPCFCPESAISFVFHVVVKPHCFTPTFPEQKVLVSKRNTPYCICCNVVSKVRSGVPSPDIAFVYFLFNFSLFFFLYLFI